MSRQGTTVRKAKMETAKAEDYIYQVRKRHSAKDGWPCTAEEIGRERDGKGLSWRQVAQNLGLANPDQARKAYTALTGRPHYESGQTTKRTRNISGKIDTPIWDDDSDQGEIEERLNGVWIEESGNGKDWRPAHWSGSLLVVVRTVKGCSFTEEVGCARVTEFTFGPQGDQPLQVWIIDKDTGGNRCFRVSDIKEVR